jgi:hypothetical protein
MKTPAPVQSARKLEAVQVWLLDRLTASMTVAMIRPPTQTAITIPPPSCGKISTATSGPKKTVSPIVAATRSRQPILLLCIACSLHSPLTRPLSAKGMKTKLFLLTRLVSIRYKYCRKSAQTGVRINSYVPAVNWGFATHVARRFERVLVRH